MTLDQQRATHALNAINTYASNDTGHYVSYVSAMPAQVISNGLGQTLATLLAAAGRSETPRQSPHFQLCVHVAAWLITQEPQLAVGQREDAVNPIETLKQLMTLDQRAFLRTQTEALLYLEWLKKFARAMLRQSDDQPAVEN